MPRSKRLTHPGAFHHVFNRGLNKQTIFRSDKDYQKFLDKLVNLNQDLDLILYSYVLLPNHFHFLIEIGKTPLATIMKKLLTSYSVYFNLKYNHHGPLLEDRYKSKLVQKDAYFWELSRYIHLNPLKAGLTNNPLRYPYSSFSEILGITPNRIINRSKVERLIGSSPTSLHSYQKFVWEGIKLDLSPFDPWRQNKEVIGTRRFATTRIKKYS